MYHSSSLYVCFMSVPHPLQLTKVTVKMYEDRHLDKALNIIEPFWQDGDRFKQRAAAELLQGILRGGQYLSLAFTFASVHIWPTGCKHWPTRASTKIWTWLSPRLPRILAGVTPDTVQIWEAIFSLQLHGRDPRRNQPLVDFILSLPLEFTGGSPFLSKLWFEYRVSLTLDV